MKLHRNPLLQTMLLASLALLPLACSKKQQASVPEKPDALVAWVAEGLADNRPEVLWQALPGSYQRDVEDLIHEAAAKMDAELWDKTFDVAEKFVRVLKEKREFILDHPMIAAQVKDRGEAEAGWDAVVGIFGTIVRSELADLDKLRKLDVERFLADTGSKMMRRMADASALTPDDGYAAGIKNLRATKATVVSSSGDRATLRIEAPGKPARQEDFVRVEGRWIPAPFADAWPGRIAEARRQVANYSGDEMQQNKQMALMQLGMAESALDSVLAAETAEQFNATAGAMLGMAMGAAMAKANAKGSGMPMGAMPPTSPMGAPPGMPMDAPNTTGAPSVVPAPSPEVAKRDTADRTQAAGEADRFIIRVSEAADHVGTQLRVIGKDGLDFVGTLTSANSKRLVFERTFGSGSMSFEVAVDDVEALRRVR